MPDHEGSTWWISFPWLDGITSAANDTMGIAVQAQEALESAVAAAAALPPAVEYSVVPLYDVSSYKNPVAVLVPFDASVLAAA
jgi:hypothetical protein